MKSERVIATVMAVLSLIGTFISYYFYIRGQLYKSVEEAIDSAESLFDKGVEKFNYVVEMLISMVPIPLRMFIRRSWIEKLVQFAFDKIENYAKKQVIKKSDATKRM